MANPNEPANKPIKAPAFAKLPVQELQVTPNIPQHHSPPTIDSELTASLDISVTSVAYLSSEEKPNILYCALLINLQLLVANSILALHREYPADHAKIPFEVKLVAAGDNERKANSRFELPRIFRRLRPRVGPQTTLMLDVPFYFPSQQEVESIGSKDVMRRRAINPQGSINVLGQGASVQGYENTTETKGPENELLTRAGFKSSSTSRNSIPVRWTFENHSRTLYPTGYTLILLVSCAPKEGPPAFDFDLILSSNFEVKAEGYTWPIHAQRTIQIRGNYEPEKVDNMLKAYRDKTPEFWDITLHALTRALVGGVQSS